MASATNKVVPFSDSNLAFDLRDFEERNMRKRRQPMKAVKKKQQKAATIALPRISLMGVVCFIALIGLLFLVVYSYMQLNEITTMNSRLNMQISELETEKAKLDTAIEQKISLADLEDRAKELGMIEPAGSQIQYFDMSGEDHAVVVAKSEGVFAGIIDRIADLFGAE